MTDAHGLALATHGLRKSYGSHVALNGLDLAVPTGTVYGFLGPNGAGKTTTMRLLTGLIHPDAGSIEVLGRPFGRKDRRRLYDVGALIEAPSFYPFLSGRQALRETLRHLASLGKTVFVSSHLLAEMQQMADVIGIIAAGKLVREGPMDQLLNAEGVVRVHVAADQGAAANTALAPLAGPEAVTTSAAEPGWLSVRVTTDKAAEVNRVLGTAGI